MKQLSKRTKRFLCIALLMCIISMLGTSFAQTNFGSSKVTTFTGTLTDVADMIRANNQKTGRDIALHFTENDQFQFSFMMLQPKNATASNPVPAIICSHGGSNSREMQLNNYIELARRGFVVISIDAAGHGRTDNGIQSLTYDSYGMLAAAEYAMSLDFVDQSKIGVTGHSMGNAACSATIQALNYEGSTQRIGAWVEGAGTMPAPSVTEEMKQGLFWTLPVCKYDEFDSVYFSSYTFLSTELAANLVRGTYPAFNGTTVPDGQWFTPEGPVDRKANGEALGASQGLRILNPALTHPAFHFSNLGTAITLQGFYDAFGVPAGAGYIDTANQVWWIAVVFQYLGLVGFFMLLFPLVEMLINVPFFQKIKQPVPEGASLPSIKDPREWATLLLTLAALMVFAFITYYKYYPIGDSAFNTNVYAAGGVPNGVALWTVLCGLFAIAMILAGYGVKRFLYRKEANALSNPFASAVLPNISGFLRAALFAVAVVALMYVPVYLAYHLFQVDFRICSLMVTSAEPNKFFIVLARYIPIWALFYVPNAVMNANTRYRDLPGWVSTAVCSVGNCLSLIVFLFIQYGSLFSSGTLWQPAAGMGGIVAFAVVPCLAFAAVSARFIYNKTGNAWAAGLINAVLMCCITCFGSTFGTDMIFPF